MILEERMLVDRKYRLEAELSAGEKNAG